MRKKNESSTEVRLSRNYDSLVQQAIQAAPSDSAAVQHARDALDARELDTLESARQAAEKITRYGI